MAFVLSLLAFVLSLLAFVLSLIAFVLSLMAFVLGLLAFVLSLLAYSDTPNICSALLALCLLVLPDGILAFDSRLICAANSLSILAFVPIVYCSVPQLLFCLLIL
jgi:hypothetical protein